MPSRSAAEAEPHARGRESLWTVPNGLSAVRLLASPGLSLLAVWDLPYACLGLFVALQLVDWLDGKLARWLNQRTVFGARLDTVADVMLYACLLAALLILRGDMIRGELPWIAPVVASYSVSVAAGLVKFRRLPSYHTRMAKTSWLFMFAAVVAAFADWSVWPLRVAMIFVLLTNLEATTVTLVLPRWRVDVPSLRHALRIRKMTRAD